jgi:hypothetical protein
MDLSVYHHHPDTDTEDIRRQVSLTNEEIGTIALCLESYADEWRTKQSQIIATYVTRGQLEEAIATAKKMNELLQTLDELQARMYQ